MLSEIKGPFGSNTRLDTVDKLPSMCGRADWVNGCKAPLRVKRPQATKACTASWVMPTLLAWVFMCHQCHTTWVPMSRNLDTASYRGVTLRHDYGMMTRLGRNRKLKTVHATRLQRTCCRARQPQTTYWWQNAIFEGWLHPHWC